jgi:SAM-dependent methyltransferase
MAISCPVCSNPSRLLAKHPEADIYRCGLCTHAFSDTVSMPMQESYEASYYDDTHRRWFEHPNTELFDRIGAVIPNGASVLDVGCGRGDFLRHLRSKRPDLQLTGLDYSKNEGEGIRFLQGDALEVEFQEKFDVVVTLAVIEHVDAVSAFTRRLRELTRQGGIVVVMTINEASILYGLGRAGRALGVSLAFDRLYSRHHLQHFTRTSLRRLLASCGLTVEQHLMHNAPVRAMDIPVRNAAAETFLRATVWAVFAAGTVTSKTYLQTAICST